MKLERIPEYLTVTVVTILGMLLALYCGKLSGSGHSGTVIGGFIGVIGVIVAIQMRAKLWLLIPIIGGFTGGFPILQLPFSIQDLVILYVFGVFLVLKALKVVRRRPTFDLVDLLLLSILFLLIAAFIRNPVGVLFMQSDRVGGKPYILVMISCLGYWVLSRVTLTPKQATWLPFAMAFTACCEGAAGFVGDHFPSIGASLSKYYSGFGVGADDPIGAGGAGADGDKGIDRKTYFVGSGTSLTQLVCSFFDPITALNPIYFFRFAAFGLGVVMILLSGFRSMLVGTLMFFALSGYLRCGWTHLVRSVLLVVPALALLILAQGTVIDLPLSVQRSFCFLPGRWDPATKFEAQTSSEWRFDMWKEALNTDRYIHNKLLGDGFGVDRKDLMAVAEGASRGIQQHISAEGLAIMGSFHSGPISTIRFVGYVGLSFLYLLMIAMAFKALRLVRSARATPFFGFSIFICTAWMLRPVVFTLIFGAFEVDFAAIILGVGMLKMLETSLAEYRAQEHRNDPAPRELQQLGAPLPVPRPSLGERRQPFQRPLQREARL